ncbi:MAG: thioredoxin family protein [Ignavibacteria bacterium]|nr:thioredoxin family protein [Ignavibacteria bacterium]
MAYSEGLLFYKSTSINLNAKREGLISMKKCFFIISILLILSTGIYSQETFKKVTDEKSGKPMLVGLITRSVLESDTAFSWWFNSEYENYSVVDSLVMKINQDGLTITIVLGTWCSDSRREVPRFLKILDKINFDKENLTLFAVDRKMKFEGFNSEKYNIEKVPTFILYKDGCELGRIIETPKKSLESDLAEIFGG